MANILGVSDQTIYNRIKDVAEGRLNFVRVGKGITGKIGSPKQTFALKWMGDFFNRFGGADPATKGIHLPPIKRNQVYAKYVSDMTKLGVNSISKKYFLRLWRKYFGHVIIHRKSKCIECRDYDFALAQTRNPLKLKQISLDRQSHWDFFMGEKQVYYDYRKKSIDFPSLWTTIILDGMDQTQTDIPLLPSAEVIHKLKVKVTGALVHGRVPKYRCFLSYNFGGIQI